MQAQNFRDWLTEHQLYPLVQAPMAGVSTPELAAAVSNSGAIGSLGLGASSLDQARTMIRATRDLTQQPFNVNVFCHAAAERDKHREYQWLASLAPLFAEFDALPPASLNEIYSSFIHSPAMLEMLLQERPAIVSFHFGLPSKATIHALKQAGILLLATATNTAEAIAAEQAGIDVVIAQGYEAGGHRGIFDPEADDQQLTTVELVQQIKANIDIAVIAAGGIMTGADINAVMTSGANTVQLGTAFILCTESAANAAYRSNLQSQRAHQTCMTTAISGRPARGLQNQFTLHGEQCGIEPAAYPLTYDVAKQLHSLASKVDNHEFAAHWAGTGAPAARSMPAAELVNLLISEAGWQRNKDGQEE